jgi:hypothetical protein
MDMDYSLIMEKAKFMFVFVFLFGIFTCWVMLELDTFCNFSYKLVRKYMRLRRLKKRKKSV